MSAPRGAPGVSVGLPVFNGEAYLAAALQSLLDQTHGDLEIVVSDNGSSDGTGEICRAFAARDARVRYHRSEANRGAAWNFNRVFELARGRYFQWAAHDDLYDPALVASCVAVLESDPGVVLCYPLAVAIDASGAVLGDRPYGLDPDLPTPRERFAALLWETVGSPAIFGLMRAEVLAGTGRMGGYHAADQVLLAELALRGRFHEIPERLMFHREHPGRSVYRPGGRRSAAAWFDPARAAGPAFPEWRLLAEYFRAVARAPVGRGDRLACRARLLRSLLIRGRWRRLLQDLALAWRRPAP